MTEVQGCTPGVFHWNKSLTRFLIREIKHNYDQLKYGKKRSIYQQIANKINKALNLNLTSDQIDSKWKGLKRTHKHINTEFSTFGKPRRGWPYFNLVNDILINGSEHVNPLGMDDEEDEENEFEGEYEDEEDELEAEADDEDSYYTRPAVPGFKWPENVILFLIDEMKRNLGKFETGKKKKVYQIITTEINKAFNLNLTHEQIDSKWKNLKKTYIRINNTSAATGKPKKFWEYYDSVEEIMRVVAASEVKEVTLPIPVQDFLDEGEGEEGEEDAEEAEEEEAVEDAVDPKSQKEEIEDDEEPALTDNETCTMDFQASFQNKFLKATKRKRFDDGVDEEDRAERRHRERMALAHRFLDLFEKMVEKM